jgi:hypothetical protein
LVARVALTWFLRFQVTPGNLWQVQVGPGRSR